MKPSKVLFVDDEVKALRYFQLLVSPIAEVLTADSVANGKAALDQNPGQIAVLISDQRMPGAQGNELLRYAKVHHPQVVRMLTTAYSELGSAIEAINSGEIYRYINKPWDLELLQTDIKHALELAQLRYERDGLLRDKMLIFQQQLIAQRVGQLAVICAGFIETNDEALATYLEGATRLKFHAPAVDWHTLDHSDLMQAEALRSRAIGQQLVQAHAKLGADKSLTAATAALIRVLPAHAAWEGSHISIREPRALYELLEGSPATPLSAQAVAWLAWLTWFSGSVYLESQDNQVWKIQLQATASASPLPQNWLAHFIQILQEK